ncbi:kinase-like domain-containing protein [Favolaschia claudopus]|uniref:Kinase-like domain-containing protein n=1 Tax=Favolaschia claudopus TaxID=2862362 RepID=A0AAV9ZIA3_9AGAR
MQSPQALPPPLNPSHWPDLDEGQADELWEYWSVFLASQGYRIMGSPLYNTLGAGVPNRLCPPSNPFLPEENESFIIHSKATDMLSTRSLSAWRPCLEICFAIDGSQRQVVLKAMTKDSRELYILRRLSSPPLRSDKRNHVIPILDFIDMHEAVIVVMPAWGMFWNCPPCGSMQLRYQMATKLTLGLVFLHEQGIAHGDIHPGNIVISHDNRLARQAPEDDFRNEKNLEYAFLDFGSAQEPARESLALPITTPPAGFCAPEQVLGQGSQAIDLFAADVYNLGKTLQRELSDALDMYGREHLRGQNQQQYEGVLLQMTHAQPSKRGTAAQALDALRSAAERTPTVT